jgi:hypothetical protein
MEWLVEFWGQYQAVIAMVLLIAVGVSILLASGKAQATAAGKELLAFIVALAKGAVESVTEAEVRRVAAQVYDSYLPGWVRLLLPIGAWCDLVVKLWTEFKEWLYDEQVTRPIAHAMGRTPLRR